MTDPNDFLDPEPELVAEPALEPAREPFFSMATLMRNLPYMIALGLAIFGVAYSNFSGHMINGYWEFLAIAIGLVCVITAWPNAPDRSARFKLIATQAAQRARRPLQVAFDLFGLERAANLPLGRRQPDQQAGGQLRLQPRPEHAEGVRLHGEITRPRQQAARVAQPAIVALGPVPSPLADQRQRRARAFEPRPHLVHPLLLIALSIARHANGAAELLPHDPAHRLDDLFALFDPVTHPSICIADGRHVQH